MSAQPIQLHTDANWGKADCQDLVDEMQGKIASGEMNGVIALCHNKETGEFWMTVGGELNRAHTLGHLELMKDHIIRSMMDED